MAIRDLILGYDFGTSSVKAALYARDGTLIAQARAPYPLHLPAPGWAEQRPEDWWRAMIEATRTLLQDGAGARVAALALSAQMCGVIPTDAQGEALGNALIWMDTRSSALAREFAGGPLRIAGYGPLKLARWLWLTGGAPNLSGKDAVSKILWLRREQPDIWARTHKLLDVKDWLLHRCTGRFATSHDCANLTWLYDARHKRWSPSLLRQIGLDEDKLPEILRATDVAQGLTNGAATALGLPPGLPVATGFGDVAAAAAGAGNAQDGNLHLCLGSSAWLAAHVPTRRLSIATGIGSIRDADGENFLLIATQENAGTSIGWGLSALGFEEGGVAALEASARRAVLRPDSPLYFPWLAGERVPVDDELLRAGFANLSLQDGQEDMALALYEGVALNLRWVMDSFDGLSGRKGQRLRIVGGGARSNFWCQLFADILEREVQQVQNPELCGALGSAMAASVAAGWYGDMRAAAAMAQPGAVLTPNPARQALHRARFAKFAAYYRRIKPWYRA